MSELFSKQAALHAIRQFNGDENELASLLMEFTQSLFSQAKLNSQLEKENAELKARLAHVESEYAKERECTCEIADKTEVLYPSELQGRARQRIKERKEL